MKQAALFLALILLLTSCASSGYNPSYIISDTASQVEVAQEGD